MFTKRGGVEFRTIEDKNSQPGIRTGFDPVPYENLTQ
mgnify:CR=1 FL=1|jgi:hypothetical protein